MTFQYRRNYLKLAGQGPKRKRNYREHGEAQAFYNWWIQMATFVFKVSPKLLWHVPNEGERGNGGLLKAEGMVAGVLDYTLAIPRGAHHGFIFEFKAEEGPPASTAQKEMIELLADQGFKTGVYHGALAAEAAVEAYMKLEPFTKLLQRVA